MRRHAWIMTSTAAVAACSLVYDLGDYSGSSKTVIINDEAGAPTTEGGVVPVPDGSSNPVDAGDAEVGPIRPEDLCSGASFCSTFATISPPEWDQALSYGGGATPTLITSNPLSAPLAVQVTKPTGPQGGGSTVVKTLAHDKNVPIAMELAVRPEAMGNGATILKLGFGDTHVVLNVSPTTMELLGDDNVGGIVSAAVIQPSLPPNVWSRLRLEVFPGDPYRVTLKVNGAAVATNVAAGNKPFGDGLVIELGVVYAGTDEPTVTYVLDDVAVRLL